MEVLKVFVFGHKNDSTYFHIQKSSLSFMIELTKFTLYGQNYVERASTFFN